MIKSGAILLSEVQVWFKTVCHLPFCFKIGFAKSPQTFGYCVSASPSSSATVFLYRLFYFGLIVYYVQSTPCSNEAFSRSASAHSNLRLLRFCKPFFICHRQRRACRLPTSHAQLVKHRTQLIIGTAQGL